MAEMNATQILENAGKPQSVTIDGRSGAQVPIKDQIEAVKFARKAGSLDGNPWSKIRRTRVSPPGAQ